MNGTGNVEDISAESVPARQVIGKAESDAYEGLMRAKEAFRAEAHRLGRELADVREALAPFAALADVCDRFKKLPDERICSWRIEGKRHHGPTAADCRNARRALGGRP